jgi:hypothetical protein
MVDSGALTRINSPEKLTIAKSMEMSFFVIPLAQTWLARHESI